LANPVLLPKVNEADLVLKVQKVKTVHKVRLVLTVNKVCPVFLDLVHQLLWETLGRMVHKVNLVNPELKVIKDDLVVKVLLVRKVLTALKVRSV